MTTRRVTRTVALDALRQAAASLGVDPADLTVSAYRAYRGKVVQQDERPPSELSISLLFGGWHRACEHAGEPATTATEVSRPSPRF